MLSLLRRPRWLILGLVVLFAAVVMVNLGLWQLRRLDDKREIADQYRSRQSAPVTDVAVLLPPGSGPSDVAPVQRRRVSARGTYGADGQVLVPNRTRNGDPGYWVVTPLRLADGRSVAVMRGWIPLSADGGATPPPPPSGRVRVVGSLLAAERVAIASERLPPGRLDQWPRVIPDLLRRSESGDIVPAFIQMSAQDPAPQTGDPEPVPLPEPGEGPHLSYAVQWFVFTTIALIGYVVLLRRGSRGQDAAAEEGFGGHGGR